MNLAEEIEDHLMRDTFGGYDWDDPIILWTIRPPLPVFTPEQLKIAERVLAAVA